MTMYQRMGRVLAGIVFVVGTILVTGCAENTASTNQDGQSAKASKQCSGGSAKACGKKGCDKDGKKCGKKCGPDCQKPCCKKADGKKCGPNCQKPCCKKAEANKCGADCKKACGKKA